MNESNSMRLSNLDMIKVLAIFMMVMEHVCEVFFSYVWEDKAFCPATGVWSVVDGWATVLSPAFFMFSMGVAINFSRRSVPGLWIRRGLKLFLTWFLLKAAYCLVAVRHLPAHEVTAWQFCVEYIFFSDILCFAGLFFVFMGLLRKLNVPKTVIALLSLGLFAAGQFIALEPTTSCLSLTLFVQAVVGWFVSTPVTRQFRTSAMFVSARTMSSLRPSS